MTDKQDDPMDIDMGIEPNSNPNKSNVKKKSSDSLMWIEKYRPNSLSDLLSHQEIITTLKTLISNNRLPHLLFYGPPGTGKTSTILACAREMYGTSFKSMVLELNASDDRGINVVRDQIKSFASTRRIFSSGVKLIILDEADAITSAAQMALRRVVEKFSSNTRFCLICNYVNKIIPALQSRCTKFRFGPIPPDDVRSRVMQIAKMENVNITDDGLQALLKLGNGDMRRILNVLQSTQMAATATNAKEITAEAIYANTGAPHPADIASIWDKLMKDDCNKCSSEIISLKQSRGLALNDIIIELLPHIVSSSYSAQAKMYLYEHIADIEHRLASGASENMNLASLIGCCKLASAISSNDVVS